MIGAAVGLTVYLLSSGVFAGCRETPARNPEVSATPSIEYVENTILAPNGTAARATREPETAPRPEASESVSAATRPPSKGTEGTAFVGNSNIQGLYIAGVLPDADYYSKVGLTVRSVFDTPMDGGTVPVIEELKGHDYSEVFILFGLNELGWPATDIFLEEYGNVIQQVHEYCPNATVYVMSILPLSKTVSDRNEDGVNMKAVNERNAQLAEVAAENDAVFLDFTSELKGPDGYLPADASKDGMHLNMDYMEMWADMIENPEQYAA